MLWTGAETLGSSSGSGRIWGWVCSLPSSSAPRLVPDLTHPVPVQEATRLWCSAATPGCIFSIPSVSCTHTSLTFFESLPPGFFPGSNRQMPVAAGGQAPRLPAPRYADCPTGTRGAVWGHFRLPGDISIASTFLPRGLLRVLTWGGVERRWHPVPHQFDGQMPPQMAEVSLQLFSWNSSRCFFFFKKGALFFFFFCSPWPYKRLYMLTGRKVVCFGCLQ